MTFNQVVAGSNPAGRTNYINGLEFLNSSPFVIFGSGVMFGVTFWRH